MMLTQEHPRPEQCDEWRMTDTVDSANPTRKKYKYTPNTLSRCCGYTGHISPLCLLWGPLSHSRAEAVNVLIDLRNDCSTRIVVVHFRTTHKSSKNGSVFWWIMTTVTNFETGVWILHTLPRINSSVFWKVVTDITGGNVMRAGDIRRILFCLVRMWLDGSIYAKFNSTVSKSSTCVHPEFSVAHISNNPPPNKMFRGTVSRRLCPESKSCFSDHSATWDDAGKRQIEGAVLDPRPYITAPKTSHRQRTWKYLRGHVPIPTRTSSKYSRLVYHDFASHARLTKTSSLWPFRYTEKYKDNIINRNTVHLYFAHDFFL